VCLLHNALKATGHKDVNYRSASDAIEISNDYVTSKTRRENKETKSCHKVLFLFIDETSASCGKNITVNNTTQRDEWPAADKHKLIYSYITTHLAFAGP